MTKQIKINLNDNILKAIEEFKSELELGSVNLACEAILDLFFGTTVLKIEKKDLHWVKYLAPIISLSNSLLQNFKKVHPEEINEYEYLKLMLSPVNQLTKNVYAPDDFEITTKDEQIYIDACNIFCILIDNLKFNQFNLEVFNRRFKNVLKEVNYGNKV